MSIQYHNLSPEEEIHLLKLELQAKTSELHKLQAISEQKNLFLTQQLDEVKARESNIKSMNETIMMVLQDITNSNTKISTELQLKQFLEERLRILGQNQNSDNKPLEEELKRTKQEYDKMKEVYEERYEDLYREKETISMRLMTVEEEKTRLLIEVQSLKGSNKGIYERLKIEHEKEISKIRCQLEELQSQNGDKCSMDLMKSQIKEMTTQHMIESNSLKTILNETRGKLERVYEAYCELKEKNSQMKTMIQGYRSKEARLKDLLFDRPQELDDEDLGLHFDVSYSNNMTTRQRLPKKLEYSSITNIIDAFSSQDYLRISPENLGNSPKTDRYEQKEPIKACIEMIKKRSLSQQIDVKPEEFSKPFELEKDLQSTNDHGDSNKKDGNNDSMEEFRAKGEIKGNKGVANYSDFLNRPKKSMKSLV